MHHSNNIRKHKRHGFVLISALLGLISAASLVKPTRLASAQAIAPSWSGTGNLNTGRTNHTATLLSNGRVLVIAGDAGGNSAELYDPVSGAWSNTGRLNTGRESQTETLLPNGKVLVAGGRDNNGVFKSAELYDSATGMWSNTGSLNKARYSHTATLLPNGKVLVAGGDVFDGNTAEVYDPATGTWSGTGNLNSARSFHTATLLPNGKVLVAAGCRTGMFGVCNPKTSAELYDPATGTWSNTGNLNVARDASSTATMLRNGKVLVAGYLNDDIGVTDSAELYDPATGLWSNTGNLKMARGRHSATLLPDGKVLVSAGSRLRRPP